MQDVGSCTREPLVRDDVNGLNRQCTYSTRKMRCSFRSNDTYPERGRVHSSTLYGASELARTRARFFPLGEWRDRFLNILLNILLRKAFMRNLKATLSRMLVAMWNRRFRGYSYFEYFIQPFDTMMPELKQKNKR